MSSDQYRRVIGAAQLRKSASPKVARCDETHGAAQKSVIVGGKKMI
jgi:hypothetical protein